MEDPQFRRFSPFQPHGGDGEGALGRFRGTSAPSKATQGVDAAYNHSDWILCSTNKNSLHTGKEGIPKGRVHHKITFSSD